MRYRKAAHWGCRWHRSAVAAAAVRPGPRSPRRARTAGCPRPLRCGGRIPAGHRVAAGGSRRFRPAESHRASRRERSPRRRGRPATPGSGSDRSEMPARWRNPVPRGSPRSPRFPVRSASDCGESGGACTRSYGDTAPAGSGWPVPRKPFPRTAIHRPPGSPETRRMADTARSSTTVGCSGDPVGADTLPKRCAPAGARPVRWSPVSRRDCRRGRRRSRSRIAGTWERETNPRLRGRKCRGGPC